MQQPQLLDEIIQRSKSKELSTFYSLLQTSHLDYTFKSPAAFTVFAPTDAAFAKVDPAVLKDIASNKTKLFLVLREHIAKGVEGIKSTDLANGMKVEMINEQSVQIIKGSKGWQVGNADESSLANIVVADIAGYSGNSATTSYMHEIDTVLLPDFNAPSKDGQVCKPKPDEKCRGNQDPKYCPAACKTDSGDTCSPSKLTTSHRGRCCPEPCFLQRLKDGTGDPCKCSGTGPTRPGPTDEPTLPPTLSPCPLTCAAPFKAKLAQGFTLFQVLSFAFRGDTCGTPCDATSLLNDDQAKQTECKGNMVFACGDGCQPVNQFIGFFFTENLLENTDGVLQCSLVATAWCLLLLLLLLLLLTRAILMASSQSKAVVQRSKPDQVHS